MAESDAEKKHAPSERRLRKARDEGQIQRSSDFPRSAVVLVGVLGALVLGFVSLGAARDWFRLMLRAAASGNLHQAAMPSFLFAVSVCGFLVAVSMIALASGFATAGWFMSWMLLLPKAEHFSPTKAWQQIFSVQNLTEVLKSVLKITVILGSAGLAFWIIRLQFLALATPRIPSLIRFGAPTLEVIGAAAGAALVIAAADVGLQYWLNRRRLRMTDEELREERKEAEGDPHVRARRRAEMRRMARARQIQAVRTASVVLTNPVHFAVAVRFRRHIDAVPVVVAKGADLGIAGVLAEARSWGVPIVEAPPLARALHRFVEVDEPIPPRLYRAVAEVLTYIWRLDQWRVTGGIRPERPSPKVPGVDGEG